MMKINASRLALMAFLVLGWSQTRADEAEDPGQEKIGLLQAQLVYATNEDSEVLQSSSAELGGEERKRLEAAIRMKFKDYRKLGADRRKILRGYENWTSPMKGSEELMVSFEPKERVGKDALRLDMEFWQLKKKVMKTDPILQKGKQLYIVGPKWRGGRLIIVLELVDLLPE
jgi:hypothetical protein